MRLALALAALVVASPAGAVEQAPIYTGGPDTGWWIIVGSGPEPGDGRRSIAGEVHAAAARCGFQPFNDFSMKFAGFRPGFEVFVVGAYRTEQEASRRLGSIRPCIPSAYLKYGTYAGE